MLSLNPAATGVSIGEMLDEVAIVEQEFGKLR
jgi:hypothetical protein